MTLLKKFSFVAPLVAGLLAIAGESANAGTLYTLDTQSSTAWTSTTPPSGSGYATIDVTVDSTGTVATIVATALDAANGDHYLFTDGGSVDLNVNGSFTGSVTGYTQAAGSPPGGWSAPSFSYDTSAGNAVDGFGKLNFQISNGTSFPSALQTMTITLTKTSGTWLSDGSNVLVDDSKGASVAAHLGVTTTSGYLAFQAGGTGFVSGGPGVDDGGGGPGGGQIPEPTSLVVWGLLSLVGIGYSRRRKVA
jgi:hypothetical protein